MPKIARELTALEIKRIKGRGCHAVGGVAGLQLFVAESGHRSWVLRARVGGKRREIGLGGFPSVSIADARIKARQMRLKIDEGIDPVHEKKERKSHLIAAQTAQITFKEATKQYVKMKSNEWKKEKHSKLWEATLEKYAYPVIGTLHVNDIELSHISKILEPIWIEKTETAKRVRGRIENVLDWAIVKSYRKRDNPARWKGYLDKMFASPGKIAKVRHYTALPPNEIADFLTKLKTHNGNSARALEFLILTVARSGEVRGALWQEIDFEKKVWTIPAERMKAGKMHRVPLSKRAIEILNTLSRFDGVDFVFAAPRGGELTDMALSSVTRRMGVKAVPQGFRSTFRDWVAEYTEYPNEVAEMALAHAIGNKVEAAYRRGDLFEKRVKMMEDWEKFCDTKTVK